MTGNGRVTATADVDETLRWGYTQEHDHPLIQIAVQTLARGGITLQSLPAPDHGDIGAWAKQVAACIASGECCGGVVFCGDPGLVCCVCNKLPGLRAAPTLGVLQAARAMHTLGANLLAVEMPGRTFFEIKQILRLLCGGPKPCCPDGVACTLRELDGHAHR